jgi:hypothetical protein
LCVLTAVTWSNADKYILKCKSKNVTNCSSIALSKFFDKSKNVTNCSSIALSKFFDIVGICRKTDKQD